MSQEERIVEILSKDPEAQGWIKPFSEFVKEFRGESDRAAVILGAAKLDYELYQILIKFLIPNVGSSDELLDGDSPLATFSSRINMCYRLGLINSEFARALHLIRKIRNSFAHEVSGCKLDSGPHRDRIRELVAPFRKTRGFKLVKEVFFEEKSGPAADFFTILAVTVIRLDGLFDSLTPLKVQYAYELIPKTFVAPEKDET